MSQASPTKVCPHGYVRGWEGWAEPDEALPEIEYCPVCDEGTTPLEPA